MNSDKMSVCCSSRMKIEERHEILTEFLLGESDPLPELPFLVFWAKEVPKRRVSYTGSTLFPQAATEGAKHHQSLEDISGHLEKHLLLPTCWGVCLDTS